jgi:4-hydroxy 2-oxovalerate aldolase
MTQYINSNFSLTYDNLEIFEILDQYIRPLSLNYKWGYEAAYYIASVVRCHPNYASFLMNKQTLHVQDIYAILSGLEDEKKSIFDEDYIGQCYIQYLNHYVDDCMTQKEISDVIGEKTVLLLAPGKSLKGTLDRINKIISEKDYYVISVNFVPAEIDVDMVFVSNNKRFSDENAYMKLIRKDLMVVITSNIRTDQANDMYVLNYSSYLNEEQCIADNAGLMCINFLKKIGIQNLILAGFDGFSVVQQDNYYEPDLLLNVEKERLMQINKAMRLKLKQLGKQINMDFLTESNYQ